MEGEGFLEFSLGCLPHVVRGNQRDNLIFPLVLQVTDVSDCRSRLNKNGRTTAQELRKIISVSDGLFKKADCFLLASSNQSLEPYSVIKVHNVDFEYKIERQNGRTRIAGMILEFEIIARGQDIGYYSGKPHQLKDLGTHSRRGRGDNMNNIINTTDNLSSKLWKQVKEGRCCDVTFSFPHCVTSPSSPAPTVKAQKNALIANSPVFEAQFEGGFSDASSEEVAILDTEPRYMRCLLQFIFTRFVPLLSLRQAFEVLYLARKYIIQDLESYCKNFIMNNKSNLAGVTDVFQYLEMNTKSCDDEISQFVSAQFRRSANVLIRQHRFLEMDFHTLETFLAESELNCHEWELVQAVRRWVVANNARVKCEEVGDEDICAHQLVECIRWNAMPIKECVMVHGWEEFKLFHDRTFLTDIMEIQRSRDGRSISHTEVVPASVNRQYSLNRVFHDDTSFVIYTTLTVDPLNLSITCLHGQTVAQSTYQQTKCSTVGPPFELVSFFVVPSYGLSTMSNNRVRLTVNLSCQGKSFNADSYNLWVRSMVKLTVFSFSPDHPAKEMRKELNFWPDRDSSNFSTLVFTNSELSHYLHTVDGVQQLDLQLQFNTDLSSEGGGDGRASPPKIMRPLRTSAPRIAPVRHRTTYDNRIDMGPDYKEMAGMGRTVAFLRAGGRRGVGWDSSGWGDVNRSPQSQEWRGGGRGYSPDRAADNTIEIQSPEYDQSEAYGDITRSPQSPGSHAGAGERGGRSERDWEDSDWAADLWDDDNSNTRGRRNSSTFPSPSARDHSPPLSISPSPIRSPSPPGTPTYQLSPRSRSLSPQPCSSHWTPLVRRSPCYVPNLPVRWSPPASPPRQVYSPVVLVEPVDPSLSPDYRPPSPSPSSPLYSCASPKFVPRSPSVIDLDFEDNDIQLCKEVVEKSETHKDEMNNEEVGIVSNENLDTKNVEGSQDADTVIPNILEANSERIEVEEDLNDQDSENLCEHGEQYEDSDSRPI